MKEALFYEKKKDWTVQCHLCPRNCVIKDGELGFCRARKNKKGKLYSITYGKIANGLSIDPIEKKPLYHFLPGSTALSFGTPGCNLRCKQCQNADISQTSPEEYYHVAEYSPEQIVETAIKEGCDVIAYTYTEPTVFFEFVLDCAKLAKKKGLKNVIVSNGFINPEPLKELLNVIDGANIDFKGNDKFYRDLTDSWVKPVQETMIALKNIWLEVTTLVIPNENDDQIDEMMDWFEENLGYEVPWHFTGFYPCYKLVDHTPTPEDKLIEIREKAISRGFKYVYAGNVVNSATNSTYCPKCKGIVIKRAGFSVKENNLKDNKCRCGEEVKGVFK